MKAAVLLGLAAVSSAIVIPSSNVVDDFWVQKDVQDAVELIDEAPLTSEVVPNIKHKISYISSNAKNAFGRFLDGAERTSKNAKHELSQFDAAVESRALTWLGPFMDRPKKGHRGPGFGVKYNLTVYEMINKSNYTKILAKLVNEDEELVKKLNNTDAKGTLFAPTDSAFKKLRHHHHDSDKKPSKEMIRKLLSYHLSPDFYPAKRVLMSHTIPTALMEEKLGGEAQRIRVGLGFKGLAINYYSRIIAVNIFGTNGVVHGIDSVLFPPIDTLEIFDLIPEAFSTLQLGLIKTGLWDALNKTEGKGQTFFAPNNDAFKRLGLKANAFLFSKYGQKYLKALLKYHVVPDKTLYSDAFYKGKSEESSMKPGLKRFHVDLPTLLDDKELSVDIIRWKGFIHMKVNAFTTVPVQDSIAKDGVIQVVPNVLLPPKKMGAATEKAEDLTVEELKERLEPHVEQDSVNSAEWTDSLEL